MPEASDSSQRRAWDRMARDDAMFYILSSAGPGEWDEDEFYASGRKMVAWALDVAAPADTRLAIDIGCGLGRTLFAFAERFGRAVGFDISAEMVERARGSERRPPNADPRLTLGAELPGVEDAAADFVFSVIVMQHVPAWAGVRAYIRETARVLAAGGVALLHFDTRPRTIPRTLYMALPDPVLPRVHRRGMRRHPRPAGRVRHAILDAGLTITHELNANTAQHWFVLRRP